MKSSKEHEIACKACGELLDMRDLGQVLSHDLYDENGERFCGDKPEGVYSSSRRIGESVQWTSDRKRIDLN